MNSWQNWNQLAADGCWISMEGDQIISPTIIPCGVPYLISWFSKKHASLIFSFISSKLPRGCEIMLSGDPQGSSSPQQSFEVSKLHICDRVVYGIYMYLLDFMIFYPYLGVYAVAKNTKRMTFSTFMSSRWSVKACLLGGKLPSFPFIPRCSYWWCPILIIL